MADFGDFTSGDFEVSDPTADFLAREKALLGDDADFLNSAPLPPNPLEFENNDNFFEVNQAQGIPLPVSHNSFSSEQVLPDSFGFNSSQVHTPLSGRQVNPLSPPASFSSQPTGIFNTNSSPQPLSMSTPPVEPESDFLKNWQAQFQDRLGDRDRRELERGSQLKEQAKAELDKFYQEYQAKLQAKIQKSNRVTRSEGDNLSGTEGWSLVTDLVAFNTSQPPNSSTTQPQPTASKKDTSRLRQLLHDLKISGHQPKSTLV